MHTRHGSQASTHGLTPPYHTPSHPHPHAQSHHHHRAPSVTNSQTHTHAPSVRSASDPHGLHAPLLGRPHDEDMPCGMHGGRHDAGDGGGGTPMTQRMPMHVGSEGGHDWVGYDLPHMHGQPSRRPSMSLRSSINGKAAVSALLSASQLCIAAALLQSVHRVWQLTKRYIDQGWSTRRRADVRCLDSNRACRSLGHASDAHHRTVPVRHTHESVSGM